MSGCAARFLLGLSDGRLTANSSPSAQCLTGSNATGGQGRRAVPVAGAPSGVRIEPNTAAVEVLLPCRTRIHPDTMGIFDGDTGCAVSSSARGNCRQGVG